MYSRSSIDSLSSILSDTSATSLESSGGAPMRVFLVQTARGLFSSSGGYKSNICLLRYLASRGHSVRQLCYFHRNEIEDYVQKMAMEYGLQVRVRRHSLHLSSNCDDSGVEVGVAELTMEDGVEIIALQKEAFDAAFGGKENIHKEMSRETAEYIEKGLLSARLSGFVTFLQDEIVRFSSTHVISNDGLSMQATSASELPNVDICRVVVLHTAEQLPFGPFAGGVPGMTSSPREIDLLHQLDGIWSVSKAIKDYAFKYGDLQTDFFVHHPWTYLEEKTHQVPKRWQNWDKKYVGMINPCAVKGSGILLDLAKACPHLDFLVYKSWGSDAKLEQELQCLPNLTTRPSCTNMDEAWQEMKVLLVPSIWYEAWGIVVIEAHLRGIPVICSDAGALPEAMRGLNHIIPVNAINGDRDANGIYVVPEQNIEPWAKALKELMSDRVMYERLSSEVRSKTEQWLGDMDVTALERWLLGLELKLERHR
ncbi:hypothetical protein QM012_005478 [Aureobasidium pullulans]|uniref:Glycosyl transferase family 1 domain-containing protein n=1 Tax=Aureobasidium pullulans TaxID=5580 RepID=A0ABR0T500_AURPU